MNLPKRMYDLSQPLYHNCPGWPGHALTVFNWEFQHANHQFNSERITMSVHTGTHIDAPYHFFADGKTIDQLPVDLFAGPLVVMDLRSVVQRDQGIGEAELRPHLSRVEKGDIVLLCTGDGLRRAFDDDYLHHYPYLSGLGAELLVEAGAKGVAIDSLSVGGFGTDEKSRPSHETLLRNGLFVLEELRVPEEILDGKKRFISAFPILLQGCGGSPARAVVYEFE
ncbi:MAG: cyclase family protein [Planctomycetaceae bacterium]|nr:cyclase family protein [Planctomycetaceae bacterium]